MLKAIFLLQNITCSSSNCLVIDKDTVLQQSNPKICSFEQKQFSSANNNYEESLPILQVSNHAQDTEEVSSITSEVHMMAIEDLQDRTNKSKCDLGLPQHTGTEKNRCLSSINHAIFIDNNSLTLTSNQNEKSIEIKQRESNFEDVPLTFIEFIRESYKEEDQSLDSSENGENLNSGKVVREQTNSENKAIRFVKENANVSLGVILGMSFLIFLIIATYISF
ncbi:hypothetical protein COBT_003242 [Conglomerata obtusa]